MSSLEQMRSMFDSGEMGLVLIRMPGIEKRIARFSQFYSRIGFVHEFRPLSPDEMQALLEQHWTPLGVNLPETTFAPEVVARLKNTISTYKGFRAANTTTMVLRRETLSLLRRFGTFVLSTRTKVVGLMSAAKHKGVHLSA